MRPHAGSEITEPVLRLAPPTCPRCGGTIRPGVVCIGESLPEDPWRQAEQRVRMPTHCSSWGSRAWCSPPRACLLIAERKGTPIIEINPERSALTAIADIHCAATAAETLPAVLCVLTGGAGAAAPAADQ